MRLLVIVAVLVCATLVASRTAGAGPNRDVAISWNDVCAIDDKGAIRCTNKKNVPNEARVARAIAFGWVLVILDDKGKVVVWNDIGEEYEAIALTFTAKQIGFIGSELCAFGTKGQLACGEAKKDGLKLREAPKGVRFVSATFDRDSIWMLDDKRNLWCEGGSTCARMRHSSTRVPPNTPLSDSSWRDSYPNVLDKVKDVARWRVASNVTRVVASGDVCIERPKQPLTCWDFAFGPRDFTFEAYDELVTVGSQACRRKGETIRCTFLDSRLDETYSSATKTDPVTTTFTVKGAVGMYAEDRKLCVANNAGAVSCAEVAGNNKVPALEAVTWAN